MNVLLIGSGGREHAIAWKLTRTTTVTRLYCAPGNAGIGELATCVPIKQTDISGLLKFAKSNDIDLTIVGPEVPLVSGIADVFEREGLNVFGPSTMGAQLEGSKIFAKEFMIRNNIPTATYKSFSIDEGSAARTFIDELHPPYVIKADGLAAGKGVIICETHDVAVLAVEDWIAQKPFGDASNRFIIEEYLEGIEASVFAISDGRDYIVLHAAQDHKRILDGDRGKNTGGMGAYAPAPCVTKKIMEVIQKTVIEPTLAGMQQLGSPYRGCLYCGLMLTKNGPKVLEYNCRFGDPEAQVVLPLIDGDLAKLLLSAATGHLNTKEGKLHDACAVCVVMASRGYPDDYPTNLEITGTLNYPMDAGIAVFHAGTKLENGKLLTAGGRVLGVTAIGRNNELATTIKTAYNAVGKITFDGAYYRGDIGKKGLAKE
jgi:phosphoribosylamine--glycine ligase